MSSGFMLFGSFIQPDPNPCFPLSVVLPKRPSPNPAISQQLWDHLLSMGVAEEDHRLTHFFTRTLFASDVKSNLTRLAIPRNQLLAPFLTDQEESLLKDRRRLEVEVVDPFLVTRVLSLSRWDFKKPSDETSSARGRTHTRGWSYALNGGWMDLVNSNRLAAGDTLQLWSFRMMDASLGLIIFKL